MRLICLFMSIFFPVLGTAAMLHLDDNSIKTDLPQIEYLGAWDALHKKRYVMLLNDAVTSATVQVTAGVKATTAQLLNENGNTMEALAGKEPWQVALRAAGLRELILNVNN